jgi:hypothetical protein
MIKLRGCLMGTFVIAGLIFSPLPAAAAPITGIELVSWTDTSLQVVRDGTSNTILIGEDTRLTGCIQNVAPVNITDGTSNTILFGELTNVCWNDRTSLPITRGSLPAITDGTSNTILLGENANPYLYTGGSTIDVCISNASIADGTSNTILLPENNEPLCLEGIVRQAAPTAPVPEPASAVMLLTAAGLAALRRRTRHV